MNFSLGCRLLLRVLLLLSSASSASPAFLPPSTLNVGAQFPLFKGADFRADDGGRRRLAAFLLALEHVNNPSDGFWDDLLVDGPLLNVSLFDSRRSEGVAVINAFKIWEKTRGASAVAAGPASSGPTARAQQVFGVQEINLPQISYSATAPKLSDAAAFPRLLRTPPSDSVQGKVIAEIVQWYGWRRVCTLSGSDEYSAGGAAEFRRHALAHNLTLGAEVTFNTGTSDVSSEIASLGRAECPILVLWAQAADIYTVGKECQRQKIMTAKDSGTLWFSSELFASSFKDVCGGGGGDSGDEDEERYAMCVDVFRGALLVTPNFGPGTPSYTRFKEAWHAQPTYNGDECDPRRDSMGQSIWIRDHDGDGGASTVEKCASVNFTDYDAAQAAADAVEDGDRDGKISTYVPWAYDAAIVIAQGIDRVFNPGNYSDEPERDSSLPAPDPNEQPAWGDLLYATMKRTSFSGFSGKVAFQKSGDRQADGAPYFFWNFEGKATSGGFKKIGTFAQRKDGDDKGHLDLSSAVVWPKGVDSFPDDRLRCDPGADFISTVGACDPFTGTRTLTLRLKPDAYCRIAGGTENMRAAVNETNVYTETYLSSRCSWTPFASPAGVAVMSACSCVFALQLFWLAFVFRYRKTNTLKYSQAEFIAVILVGLASSSATQLSFLGLPTDLMCNVRIWMWNISIALVTSPLLVKIRRVYLIFEANKTMKRRKDLGLKPMMLLLFKILSITLLILIVGTSVPSLRPTAQIFNQTRSFVRTSGSGSTSDTDDVRRLEVEETMCVEQGTAGLIYSVFRATIHALTIILIAFLGYKSRSVPSSFNESASLNLVAMCILSVGGITGVVILAAADLDLPPAFQLGITTTGVLITVTISGGLLLCPRWLYIRSGDHKWNVTKERTTGMDGLSPPKKSLDGSGSGSGELAAAASSLELTPPNAEGLRRRLNEKNIEIARLRAELEALNAAAVENPKRVSVSVA